MTFTKQHTDQMTQIALTTFNETKAPELSAMQMNIDFSEFIGSDSAFAGYSLDLMVAVATSKQKTQTALSIINAHNSSINAVRTYIADLDKHHFISTFCNVANVELEDLLLIQDASCSKEPILDLQNLHGEKTNYLNYLEDLEISLTNKRGKAYNKKWKKAKDEYGIGFETKKAYGDAFQGNGILIDDTKAAIKLIEDILYKMFLVPTGTEQPW